jgi:hypothetical protein
LQAATRPGTSLRSWHRARGVRNASSMRPDYGILTKGVTADRI